MARTRGGRTRVDARVPRICEGARQRDTFGSGRATRMRLGQEAPDFTLPDQDDNEVTLSELRARPVVLYFYPEADTR
jgi:AhpC/TSA family